MELPRETPVRRQAPWYLPRSRSQEVAWIITAFALAVGAIVILAPKLSGDEVTNREYLVILLLGASAIVLGLFVVDRLRLQAGERLVPRRTLPWRDLLRTEDTLRRLSASWMESKGRLQLSEVDLHEASLPGADLRAADLSEASLHNARLGGANLQHADLKGADLRGADLRRSNLAWSSLIGAKLEGARLERAILFGADLRETNLGDANLACAIYDEETCWPDDFSARAAGAELAKRRERDA